MRFLRENYKIAHKNGLNIDLSINILVIWYALLLYWLEYKLVVMLVTKLVTKLVVKLGEQAGEQVQCFINLIKEDACIVSGIRKCCRFVIFSMFSFGYLGRNLYLCSDVCNMLIINGYFRFCDMCATSGANALIVS